MEIYLIRHTTPEIEKGICYGQSNISLANSFPEEFNKLSRHLPKSVDAIYSSPLDRCHKMAQIMAGKELCVDNRLLELNFGDWEMKKWDTIEQVILNKWMNDFVNEKVINGESFLDLNTRVIDFINDLLKSPHENSIIVTHAGVIRCFILWILEIPLKNAFKITIDYASVTKIKIAADKDYNNIYYLNKL